MKAAAVSEDVDLSGIEIHASQIQKDGEEADRYAAAEELVVGALDAESRQIEELQAYDIWFTYTESGETADLSGQVQISLEYTEPEFPEGTDAQLEVFCLNDGAAEAVDGTDALAAGCELYALAWTAPAGYEETWEDDQVTIHVFADAGVLPNDAVMVVTPLVETEITEDMTEEQKQTAQKINDQYALAEEKLEEENEKDGRSLEGFVAYDISFFIDEEEVQPQGKVSVSMEFKVAVLPENVSGDAEVSVRHLKEDQSTEGEMVLEDMTDKSEVTITEDTAVQKVALTTESFSTFAVDWSAVSARAALVPLETNSENIDINLFNYNSGVNDSDNALVKKGFWFNAGGGVDGAHKEYNNAFTPDGTRHNQEIVKKNLGDDGFPVLNVGNNAPSMADLFSTAEKNNYKTSYSNVTGLFQLDEQGYYSYDSRENGAVYDKDDNELKIYNAQVWPSPEGSAYDVGNFFPFTDWWLEQVEEGGNYKFPSYNNVDYWFGMNVGLNFYQPKDGNINGEKMVFEFAGDDDVWVFIDGVLVLDLGGIHGQLEGTIDFATGNVNAAGVETSLRNCFAAAYRERHGNSVSDSKVNEYLDTIFDEKGRFLDYSDHRLEFFYLERGGGAANCKLKFNMPSLPSDGITVSKIIDNYDDGAYTDVEFEFELYYDKDNDGTVSENEKVTGNDPKFATYTLKQIGSTGAGQTVPLGDNGIFKLKHNEMATFDGLDLGRKYKIREVGVTSQEYDQVKITSSGVTDIVTGDDVSNPTDKYYAETHVLEVGSNVQVVFHNRCSATNMKQLYIRKKLKGEDSNNKEFTVRVDIGGVPYVGQYKIGASEGQGVTFTTNNGMITFEADKVVTLLGNVKTEDGKFQGFPSGTTFTVTEINLEENTYIDPAYTIESGSAEIVSTEGAATGRFILETNADVTVINAVKSEPDSSYIEVQKIFEGIEEAQVPEGNFKITVSKDAVKEELKISQDNKVNGEVSPTYRWELKDIEAGPVAVEEENEEVSGYDVNAAVNGKTMINGKAENITFNTISLSIGSWTEIESLSSENILSGNMDNLLVGKIKTEAGQPEQYLVWTKESLSAGERTAIIAAIRNKELSGITVDNTVFFSTEDRLNDGINYIGTVSVNWNNESKILYLTTPDKWESMYYGTYANTGDCEAEIEVVNTYISQKVIIDLQKYGKSYEGNQLSGSKFSLYAGEYSSGAIHWKTQPISSDLTNFEVSNENTSEISLDSGYYKLVETEAPTGFQLLDENIYFKIESGVVSLITENGEEISDNKAEMWELKEGETTFILKILNRALYELPSTGGPGIYLYMLGGVALMIAGTLLVYKKRKEEVLRS